MEEHQTPERENTTESQRKQTELNKTALADTDKVQHSQQEER